MILRHLLSNSSDAPAILSPGREPLTYRRLAEQLDSVAEALSTLGIGAGDRVASVLPSGPDAAVALLSVGSVATFAPLNPAQQESEFEYLFSQLSPQAVLIAAGEDGPAVRVARLRGIPLIVLTPGVEAGQFSLRGSPASKPARRARPTPGDIALILCTSGSTGRPKLVPLSHTCLCLTATWLVESLKLTPADRCLNFSAMFHVLGINGGLLAPLAGGGSVVCAPAFDIERFFEWLDQYQPTWFSAVPAVHQAILERAPRHTGIVERQHIRFMRTGGAPLPQSVVAEIERTFRAPLLQVYGMTEVPPIANDFAPPDVRKPGSVGRRRGNAVEVMDQDGRLLPEGATGEVVVSGPAVTSGYLNNPAATADAFHRGWFRTGDIGYFDADGYLFLTGRSSEFINRGGEKVSPVEVDEVLLAHPAVAEAVSFGIPDQRLGQELAAAVVLRTLVSESELQQFAAERLAEHKVPRRIVTLPEIPKGPTGKIRRTGLAEMLGLNERAPAAARFYVEPRNESERAIASIWAEVLELDRVGIHDNFFELGGNSLSGASSLERVGAALGLKKLALVTLLLAPTVAKLSAWLADPRNLRQACRVLPLQPNGDGLPLFVVAPGLEYQALTRHLGARQPVFGIEVPNLEETPAPDTIEGIASECVATLRRFRPHGPYALCGWCMAGVIAYEIAQQLQAQGEEVPLLSLIDARDFFAPAPSGPARWLFSIERLMQRARHRCRQVLAARGSEKLRLASGLVKRVVGRLTTSRFVRTQEQASIAALHRYRPRPWNGPLVHIWARERAAGSHSDVEYCWGHLAHGGIVFREVPGDHHSVFHEPNARVLAQHIAGQLQALEPKTTEAYAGAAMAITS